MANNPFTPELHRLLKRNLQANLTTISGLNDNQGLKLKFLTTTGLFEQERDGFNRTMRNVFSKNEDSATADQMFAAPLLVSFYECRKLGLKMPVDEPIPEQYQARLNERPEQAFGRAYDALTYLQRNTYANKATRRTAIQGMLDKAQQLRTAPTRQALDGLITRWVDFVVPGAVTKIVNAASQDEEIRDRIRRDVTAGRPLDPTIVLVGRMVYGKYYKTGGEQAGSVPWFIDAEGYLQNVQRLAARRGAQAKAQGWDANLDIILQKIEQGTLYKRDSLLSWEDLSFLHFTSSRWGYGRAKPTARVYIHVRAERDGRPALDALGVIFDRLPVVFSRAELVTRFSKFKVCNVPMQYRYADSIVMWTADYESARVLARDLSASLGPYLASGLPTAVKPVGTGIGISTEPEVQFDRLYKALPHAEGNYSYGTHRSEVIARGLIDAARANGGALPAPATCGDYVALKFAEYSLDPFKPYKKGSIPIPLVM